MIRPGPANHIIDVPGIKVGHAHDKKAITGVTVVLPEHPAVS
ncbi:MAG: P1 family peptidase, partial [SAR324 cluster bacterium]|nr:P1 family peptidase [SAR324 cluster bacterium]